MSNSNPELGDAPALLPTNHCVALGGGLVRGDSPPFFGGHGHIPIHMSPARPTMAGTGDPDPPVVLLRPKSQKLAEKAKFAKLGASP